MQITKKEAESLKWWIEWTEEHVRGLIYSYGRKGFSKRNHIDMTWVTGPVESVLNLKNRIILEKDNH